MTTTELYNALIRLPDLHSVPQLQDQVLVWPLYPNAYVQAYCQEGDCYIGIQANSLFRGELIHWHPEEAELLDRLYALGKRGNILILKKTLLGTQTFYMGPADACPLSQKSGLHLGRKKWDGGVLTLLEQK